jgi:hypothetical protein
LLGNCTPMCRREGHPEGAAAAAQTLPWTSLAGLLIPADRQRTSQL